MFFTDTICSVFLVKCLTLIESNICNSDFSCVKIDGNDDRDSNNLLPQYPTAADLLSPQQLQCGASNNRIPVGKHHPRSKHAPLLLLLQEECYSLREAFLPSFSC